MKLREALLIGILCLSTPTSSTPIADTHGQWVIGQTVHTQSGPVSGHAASSAQNVSAYLGIPYARPPIGNLRFAPSKPYYSHKPIDGSKFVCHLPSNLLASL